MEVLSVAQKQEFEQRIRKTKDVGERNRLCVILAWSEKKKVEEIAFFLKLPESAIYHYINEFINQSKK